MRRPSPWLVALLAAAALGAVFAALSTYDFVQHLDRQVHALHCSFIPGLTGTHSDAESGCQVAMMSPYSSVLRTQVWGGVPIALAALSVFAFLVFYALDLMLSRRKDDPRATGFLALATVLPAATSVVMLVLSLAKLGTTCKLCVAIYVSSAVCLVCGIGLWRRAVRGRVGAVPVRRPERPDRRDRRDRQGGEPAFVGARSDVTDSSGVLVVASGSGGAASTGFLAAMFAAGVGFVAVPVVLYLALAPDHARFIGTCEALPRADDSYKVMVKMVRGSSGVPAIEVLDPLCPACRAFEQRLEASGLADRLDRKAMLFPLDNTCNWMVTEATHPGACTVSEAVLCAGDKAPEVIAWAFEEQDRIRSETKANPAAAARIVKQRFPELASCVGSTEARSRLNKSLRWVVANNIRVVTPQLYIDKVKLCDEDVDLGLEYMLSNMLDRHARGTLAVLPLENDPAAAKPSNAGKADKPAGSADKSDKPADKTDKPAGSADKPDKPSSADKATDKPARSDGSAENQPDGPTTPDKAATPDKQADNADESAKPTAKPAKADRQTDKADESAKPTAKPVKPAKADNADESVKPATKPAKPAAKPAKAPAGRPAAEHAAESSASDKPVTTPGADRSGDQPVTQPGGTP